MITTTDKNTSNPTMTREWFVELNTSDGVNFQLRCSSTEQAVSYVKKIFPSCYIKPIDPITSYVYLDKNAETVVGIITEIQVPNTWVTNRRLTELESEAA